MITKKELIAIWVFSLGLTLIALAVSVGARQWGWSAIMILVIAYDLYMLRPSQ